VKHLQADLLQRYLAGEADLTEQDTVVEHLAECDECASLLADMAADDRTLTAALRLTDAEAAWIAGMDLTQPVMTRLAWYREPSLIVLALLALLPGTWILGQAGQWMVAQLTADGPVGTALAIGGLLGSALWNLLVYASNGGLLVQIWPVLILAAGYWLGRRYYKKEDKSHA